jgi:hypothetical protein
MTLESMHVSSYFILSAKGIYWGGGFQDIFEKGREKEGCIAKFQFDIIIILVTFLVDVMKYLP